MALPGKWEAIKWIQHLYQCGIRKYYHGDLPHEQQNIALQRSAQGHQLVRKTGKYKKVGPHWEWEIATNIMMMTSPTQKDDMSKFFKIT